MNDPATEAVDTRMDRLVVPDVLRGVAILSMLIAHAVPFLSGLPGPVHFAMIQLSDLASPLFALVLGISAQIVLQRTPRSARGLMFFQQGMRALVLIALGLWLSSWGTWVAVVLSYLGIVLLVGVPLLLLSTRWLAVVALAVAILSDPVNAWARATLWPIVGESPILNDMANWMFLGFTYRASNLLPFFLLGALLMRHGFRRDRALWIMAAIVPLAYVVRPLVNKLTGLEAVSGSYADTLHDVSLVFAVYVVIVVLSTVTQPSAARIIEIVFEPLRAVGATALSIYLFHVGLIALMGQAGYVPIWRGYGQWTVIVIGVTMLGWLWWRFIGVGPVEWLLGWVTLRPKRWGRGRTRTAVQTSASGG